jgi:hypothetical protein
VGKGGDAKDDYNNLLLEQQAGGKTKVEVIASLEARKGKDSLAFLLGKDRKKIGPDALLAKTDVCHQQVQAKVRDDDPSQTLSEFANCCHPNKDERRTSLTRDTYHVQSPDSG